MLPGGSEAGFDNRARYRWDVDRTNSGRSRQIIRVRVAIAFTYVRHLLESGPMTEITYFMAVPFDYVDDGVVAGEPIGCPGPAAAIQRAQGLWRTFGHAGAIAISRTTDFKIGQFGAEQVLRRFGQVPAEYQHRRAGERR